MQTEGRARRGNGRKDQLKLLGIRAMPLQARDKAVSDRRNAEDGVLTMMVDRQVEGEEKKLAFTGILAWIHR